MSKTINEITLYELMAEDFSVWVCKNKKFGFDLHIEGDDISEAIKEKGIHPYAMESLADFCRRFVHFYDQVNAREEAQFESQLKAAA